MIRFRVECIQTPSFRLFLVPLATQDVCVLGLEPLSFHPCLLRLLPSVLEMELVDIASLFPLLSRRIVRQVLVLTSSESGAVGGPFFEQPRSMTR